MVALAPFFFGGPVDFADVPPSSIAAARPDALTCPDDMVPVEGTHYENVERLCLRWTGQQCFGFWPFAVALEGGAHPVRACMDRYEWPNKKGAIPEVMMRFTEAEQSCKNVGKRLCSEYEWELACEGSEARPFPYGFTQEKDACNVDKPYRNYSQRALSSGDKAVRDRETARLFQGAPSGAYPKCVSPAGVVDLVGNVEEWVSTSRKQWPWPSSLKGGYWSKAWAGCRGTNDSHGPLFRFYEIGFRCCSDPR
jgi:hypothetical protein